MEERQIIANWAQHLEDGVKIIVNVKDYNMSEEERLLVPFIAQYNNKGQSNKMGLLNHNGEVVLEPLYDTILDDCYSNNDIIRIGSLFPYGYSSKNGSVTSYVRYKYKAMMFNGEFITDMEFDSITTSTDNKYITVQDREKGYAAFDRKGIVIVPFGKYSWMDGFDHGLSRVKKIIGNDHIEDKWGIINTKGEEVLPLIYDKVWNFYGKNRFSTKAIKDGVEKDVFLHDLNPDLPRHGKYRILTEEPEPYGRHYGEYAGTYAQDVAGYSDDVINDAFDGEHDAYWNID